MYIDIISCIHIDIPLQYNILQCISVASAPESNLLHLLDVSWATWQENAQALEKKLQDANKLCGLEICGYLTDSFLARALKWISKLGTI